MVSITNNEQVKSRCHSFPLWKETLGDTFPKNSVHHL